MSALVEELVLLSLDEGGNLSHRTVSSAFRTALIGACLIELNQQGRLDVELDGVKRLSGEKTGQEPLDWVLEHLDWDVLLNGEGWILRHTAEASALMNVALEAMVRRGVLELANSKRLWLFKQRAFAVVEPLRLQQVKLRIHATLLGDALPTPHDSALIGLADLAGLLEGFISAVELARLQPRLETVGGLDLVVRGLGSAVLDDNLSRFQPGPDIQASPSQASLMSEPGFVMEPQQSAHAWVARPVGRLDYDAAASFQTGLEALVASAQATKQPLVLNLAGLRFVSSAGLRAFLVAARAAQSVGVPLTLCELTGAVRDVFEQSGFSRLMRIVATENDAIAPPETL